jgi:hypothetical protein
VARRFLLLSLIAAGLAVVAASVSVASPRQPRVNHVLLISVDGLHQSDLEWLVAQHPSSELAKLVRGGAEFSNAHAADPSDSDPGGTAIMTGGDPPATGVYYDVEYSHGVFPPGTTDCSGPVPGGNAIYDSPDDKLPAVPDLLNNGSGNTFPSFDEGGAIYPGGVDTNPGAIMNLSPRPQSGLDPATFPVDPNTCKPIMPWDYLKVNTIFQVIHNAGMRTAWSDKHAIYTSFNGPGSGGNSIDDFFGPEIDSQAVEPNGVPYPQDDDWAHIDAATKQYDGYKVQAVLNELNGIRPQRYPEGWCPGAPGHELPGRLGRREGRLARHHHPEPGRELHARAEGARRLPPGHVGGVAGEVDRVGAVGVHHSDLEVAVTIFRRLARI